MAPAAIRRRPPVVSDGAAVTAVTGEGAVVVGSGADLSIFADRLTAVGGAYVLAVRLIRPLSLRAGALAPAILAAGTYLYAGSAFGPGGLRARLGRHLRPSARAHWHIDHLLAAGAVAGLFALPGGRECALLRGLLALPGVGVPIPGFGASDCRTCPAHLVALPAEVDLRRAFRAAGAAVPVLAKNR